MQFSASVRRRALCVALLACASVLTSCSGSSGRGSNYLGTFRMGEKVQAPPLTYTVIEAAWKPELHEGGRAPKHRFLFLRVSATNNGQQGVTLPPFQLESADRKTTCQEVTENMEGVQNWLGMLRTVGPGQTQTGYAVFDAPMAAYKLHVFDGADVEKERFALIDIPVMLE